MAKLFSQSLDLPSAGSVDTLAQELAILNDKGKRRIAFLGSRHVPVVDIHLIELIARSLAEEGNSIITSGSQGVNVAVIRAVLEVNPGLLTVLLPQSLDRQLPDVREQLKEVLHLVEKSENDNLPLPVASSLCNQEIINRSDQLICFAFHDSETILNSCRCAEDMGKVVSLLFFD
tara:strand:- start:6645 stop:7169 length:525 start_codon:yes stop_codon:yes gene_type:complete